jgi:leucyl-tRNA synthetase
VQVNGRTRGLVELKPDASEAEALEAARHVGAARQVLEGDSVKRVIYVAGRIINLVSTRP